MDVKHVSAASKEEISDLFESVDTVLFDCDGVVWIGGEPIPGTADCIATLKSMGKKVGFVTNNSVYSRAEYEQKFAGIGVKLGQGEIFHPAITTVKYLQRIKFSGLIYCIGSPAFKAELSAAGYEYIDDPQDRVQSLGDAGRIILSPAPKVKAVIMDTDINLSFSMIARAAFLLRKPDILFIAGSSDTHYPVTRHINLTGPGYFTKIVEEHTGRKATVLAKPSKDLVAEVLNEFGKNCLFIGDALDQDMGFATECGFKKILVLSGGTTKADLERRFDWTFRPDYYADSLLDLHQVLQSFKL